MPKSKKILKTFAENVYLLRMGQQKEIEEVAEEINMPVSLLKKIEKGRYNPLLTHILKLTRYYKVSPDDLLNKDFLKKSSTSSAHVLD